MSAASIQARIKRGLARAVDRTGSSNSEKVYLISTSENGGKTPLNTPIRIETPIELVDAVFTEYVTKNITDTEIKAGDRRLVTNNDVEIKQDDIIQQGDKKYFVVNTDIKAPTSDVLAYISQCRLR